jgi:hypothetical protein
VKMRHREDGEASAPFYRAGDEVNGREAFDRRVEDLKLQFSLVLDVEEGESNWRRRFPEEERMPQWFGAREVTRRLEA